MKNAKAKRTRNNVIVHIILAILAAIWVFPIFWVILTSFRAEKGHFFPKLIHWPITKSSLQTQRS